MSYQVGDMVRRIGDNQLGRIEEIRGDYYIIDFTIAATGCVSDNDYGTYRINDFMEEKMMKEYWVDMVVSVKVQATDKDDAFNKACEVVAVDEEPDWVIEWTADVDLVEEWTEEKENNE